MSGSDPSAPEQAVESGRARFDRLIPAIYERLRVLAAREVRGDRQQTSPSSVVHETYVRLAGRSRLEWQDRAHLIAIAAAEMRRVLVDRARRTLRHKRGGGVWRRVDLHDLATRDGCPAIDILALEEALRSLEALNLRYCRIAEMRIFGELSHRESAQVLDVSEETVKKSWRFARAWLQARLAGTGPISNRH